MNKPTATFSIRLADSDENDRIAPLFNAYRRLNGRASDVMLARDFLADRLASFEAYLLFATNAY